MGRECAARVSGQESVSLGPKRSAGFRVQNRGNKIGHHALGVAAALAGRAGRDAMRGISKDRGQVREHGAAAAGHKVYMKGQVSAEKSGLGGPVMSGRTTWGARQPRYWFSRCVILSTVNSMTALAGAARIRHGLQGGRGAAGALSEGETQEQGSAGCGIMQQCAAARPLHT